MAGLNRTVYRDAFIALLIGFVPASLLLSAVAIVRPDGIALVLTLAQAALYMLGVMLVTGLGAVPIDRRPDHIERVAGRFCGDQAVGRGDAAVSLRKKVGEDAPHEILPGKAASGKLLVAQGLQSLELLEALLPAAGEIEGLPDCVDCRDDAVKEAGEGGCAGCRSHGSL